MARLLAPHPMRLEILIIALVIGIVPAAIVGIVANNRAAAAVESAVQQQSREHLQTASAFVGDQLNTFFHLGQSIQNNPAVASVLLGTQVNEAQYAINLSRVTPVLRDTLSSWPQIEGGAVIDSAGKTYGWGIGFGNDFQLQRQNWYPAAVQQLSQGELATWVDEGDGRLILALPNTGVRSEDQATGWVLLSLSKSGVQQLLQQAAGSAEVQLGLVMGGHLVAANTDAAVSSLRTSWQQSSGWTKGNGFRQQVVGSRLDSFSPNGDWGLLMQSSLAAATQARNGIVLATVAAGVLAVLFAVGGSWVLRQRIVRPVERLHKKARELAEGHISAVGRVVGPRELVDLSESLHVALVHLAQVLHLAQQTSATVTAEMASAREQVHNSADGSEQVATAVASIAEGATSQATDVGLVLSMSQESDAHAQEAGEETEAVSVALQALAQESQATSAQLEELTGHGSTLDHAAQETIDEVHTLLESLGEIPEIVETVRETADQTTLLALNAAIEAAHAGAAGAAFGVVADEVRELAERTQQQVGHVTPIVADIQERAANAAQRLAEMRTVVSQQIALAGQSSETFRRTAERIAQLQGRVERARTAVAQVIEQVNATELRIENIAAVTQESAATVEEISAITEEQSATMQAIDEALGAVAVEIEALHKQLQFFAVDEQKEEASPLEASPPGSAEAAADLS
ncbi:MAG: methyl-accepting chemotaxis protein [Firmicutes bacterium]|nr:methyl-accepting chemotaxis protein [Bacillota bacterium]